MLNVQNIYQKHFGDIETKIDEKNPQFEPPIDLYGGRGGKINLHIIEMFTWHDYHVFKKRF
jgi:hypothetical protein